MKAQITVKNGYFHNISETFIIPIDDPSNLNEVNDAVEQAIDAYFDIHHDMLSTIDASWDNIYEATEYIFESAREEYYV